MKKYSKLLKKKSHVIFLFHGVINKNKYKVRNYTKKHIHKNEFLEVLNDLNYKGHNMSLDQVYETIINKKDFIDYSYSLTFDDGFYNNYKIAAPILKKKKLHTTFYVTTSFVEKNKLSWIDKIEYMIEKIKTKKSINIFNKKFEIKCTKRSKISFLKTIRFLAKRNMTDLNKLVTEIKIQLGNEDKLINHSNILDKKMNWKQLKKLNESKYFTIGGHSVNHPILSFLKYSDAKKEIYNSINLIEKNLKIKVKHFSYPEGLKHTYGKREILFLKKKGIKICPSAVFGINNKNSNLFHLKRVFVNG